MVFCCKEIFLTSNHVAPPFVKLHLLLLCGDSRTGRTCKVLSVPCAGGSAMFQLFTSVLST